ncbi:MAG: hypothetical protein JXA33_26845 [Anaerolineae bacterium]|nr:hypothetical protein [Anaerolineae bacterium]
MIYEPMTKILVPEKKRPPQYPGLVALVSADTRKDKTGSKQAVEIAIEYHLGIAGVTPPSPAEPLVGIPPDLQKRLLKTLLTSHFFDTDEHIRSLFLDQRVGAWRWRIPQANTPYDRVMQVTEFLFDQFSADTGWGQENALVLLLRVLQGKIEPGDALHLALEELATALERITHPPVTAGGAPLRYCWLIASAGERGSLPQALEIQQQLKDTHTVQVDVCEVYDAFGIQETYDLVRHIYTRFVPQAGLRIQDVIADFTGSTKPMSTGMMLACTHLGAPMQYMYGDRDHIASVPRWVAFESSLK